VYVDHLNLTLRISRVVFCAFPVLCFIPNIILQALELNSTRLRLRQLANNQKLTFRTSQHVSFRIRPPPSVQDPYTIEVSIVLYCAKHIYEH
jgi:hypothetical protein